MVQGLAALEARWSRIPGRIRAAVEAAMEKVAEEVVRDMRLMAPKGETGDLVRSIGWTWGDAPKGAMTIGKTRQGRAYGALTLTFYAGGGSVSVAAAGRQGRRAAKKFEGDAFYARFQEFGTQDMAANPFFYPVWRIWRKRVRSRISAAIRKAIRGG